MLRFHFISALFFVLSFLFCSSVYSATDSNNPAVRVRFAKKVSVARIVGFGLRFGQAHSELNTANSEISNALPTKKRINLYRIQDGFRVEENGRQVSIFPPSALRLIGDEIKIEGERAPDVLYFVPRPDGDMDIIAEMPLENYLKGVLPAEMPASWPIEAMKAQAIASRTYAESIMKERAGETFHLDSTVDHQVFHWESYTGGPVQFREKVARAVDETKGIKLVDTSGEVIRAYFHSHCGGTTEEPVQVWGYGKSTGVVKDEYCVLDRSASWRALVSKKVLQDKLGISSGIDTVYLGPPDASGRNTSVIVVAKDKEKEISGQEFRKIFGFSKVKSTRFTVLWTGEKLVVNGRGNGHGAGLCQTGSKFMALAGSTHIQILNRYYPKAQISFPSGSIAAK